MVTAQAKAVLDRIYASDAAQREAGLPTAARTRNVVPNSGQLLALLARTIDSSLIVEIGSSNGAGMIWLASGVRHKKARVVGTEVLPERVAEANANLTEAGLDQVAEVREGDAREIVATLDGSIDLVFIDAEKDDYSAHFEAVWPKVRPGGFVIADNVTSHDCTVYQNMLRGRDDLDTMTLEVDRGLEVTVKREG